jgi:predicted DNA-binding antitoxin AbrB/MazE fold protein
MTSRFVAVFENGVLRPTVPLPLKEGDKVNVLIYQSTSINNQDHVADILAKIAALPTLGGDPSTSREHERVIYGDHGSL